VVPWEERRVIRWTPGVLMPTHMQPRLGTRGGANPSPSGIPEDCRGSFPLPTTILRELIASDRLHGTYSIERVCHAKQEILGLFDCTAGQSTLRSMSNASRRAEEAEPRPPRAAVDIRIGGVRLTVQRVPAWLFTLLTTAAGSGVAWWTNR
jgi:hypothetical protein